MLGRALGVGEVVRCLAVVALLIDLRLVKVLVSADVVGIAAMQSVALTVLRLAAEGVVLWDCAGRSHAIFFALGELLDVQADLLCQ